MDKKVDELSMTGEHTDQWMAVNRKADFSSLKGFQACTHTFKERQGGNEGHFWSFSAMHGLLLQKRLLD